MIFSIIQTGRKAFQSVLSGMEGITRDMRFETEFGIFLIKLILKIAMRCLPM